VLIFEGRIKIGKMCIMSTTAKTSKNQTNKQTWMFKKSLKITKGQSESVNRRRTYKTMTTKSSKGQTTI
jgi:hypothetical protein